MVCSACGTRAAVAYCAVCRKPLCDACGMTCAACTKRFCSDHMASASSRRRLCTECAGAGAVRPPTKLEKKPGPPEIKPDKEPVSSGGFSFADLMADGADEGLAPPPEPGPVVETLETPVRRALDDKRPILAASGYQPPAPWKQSLTASIIALALGLVVASSPGFRAIAQPWASIMTLGVAAVAGWMALAGLAAKGRPEGRVLNWIGLGIVLVVVLLAFRALSK